MRNKSSALITLTSSLLLGTTSCSEDADPGRVQNLAATSVGTTAIELQWSEVSSGQDRPANYKVAKGSPTLDLSQAQASSIEIEGKGEDSTQTYVFEDLLPATQYQFAVVSFRTNRDGSLNFGRMSNLVSVTTTADAPEVVSDLATQGTTTNSITLNWSPVSNGAGGPSDYLVAIASPTIDWGTAVNSAVEVPASPGGQMSHTISDLAHSTGYQIQVAAFRGAAGADRVVGPPSAVLSASTSAPIPPPSNAAFFSDEFDSGSKVNANGFTWASTGPRVTVSSERAFSGTHALRFRFGPDSLTKDSSAEQRFNLGRNLGRVWLEFQLYVPANFTHRNDAPSNNKLFMIWNTTYGSGSGTWQAGYEYTRTSDSTSRIRAMSSKEFGTNATFVTDGELNHPSNGLPFIGAVAPLKPGQWTRIRMEFARSSAGGATDGIMRMWIGDVLFAEMTNGPFRNLDNVGETVLRNGYFLGWSNSGFAAETIFFIDDVRFFDANPGWIP